MRTVKMSFWVYYDHLGKLLVVNFLCACAVLVPLMFAHAAFVSGNPRWMLWCAVPMLLTVVVVVFPLSQVGLLWLIKELLETRDGSVKTAFVGIRKFGIRAVLLGCFYALFSFFLASSVWFYGVVLGATAPLLGYSLSAAALWAQAFLLFTAVVAFPALVNKNAAIGDVLKMAAVLTVDNPLFLAGVFIAMTFLMAFFLLPPTLLFFSFAPLAALQGSAYEILSRKYAAIQAHLAAGGNRDKSFQIDFGDDDDEYLCRGFRDLLFPWKE